MKNLITVLALTFSFSALANNSLPDAIKCTSNGTSSAVQSFSILEINSFEPEATIPDQSFLQINVDAGRIEISFSNECDNGYGITLSIDDLRDLKNGKVKEIKGMIDYSDVELSEARNTEEAQEEKVEIVCRLN